MTYELVRLLLRDLKNRLAKELDLSDLRVESIISRPSSASIGFIFVPALGLSKVLGFVLSIKYNKVMLRAIMATLEAMVSVLCKVTFAASCHIKDMVLVTVLRIQNILCEYQNSDRPLR